MSEGDRADRTDSTGAGDRLGGADDIRVLPDGVVRLSDPSVRATAPDGAPAVAWPIAHRGRVTLLHAREKLGTSTLLRAAVAAVTRGEPFLEQPTIGGRVLWVGDEAVGDVKAQLAESVADLDRVFCIRGLRPDTDDESSLRRLVARLRPVWVIIDPWQQYRKVYQVTGAAGPAAPELLLGDIVDVAREYEAAMTVSHHNAQNRPDASTDSSAFGAVADMIVSLGRGESPTTRRLEPSGRWHLDPVDIRWTRGLGYSVVKGTEPAARSRTHARPIDDGVLLHLLELGADVRPPARELAARLRCQGRRYDELRSALERLLAEGVVDCAQRPDARSDRDRGYALTERGRHRAETLREASDSGASTNREEAEACSEGATVSKVASPALPRNGNATPPAREEEAEASSEGASVSKVAVPAVAGRRRPPERKRRRRVRRARAFPRLRSQRWPETETETQHRPPERKRRRRVRRARAFPRLRSQRWPETETQQRPRRYEDSPGPAEPGTSATRWLGMGRRSPRVDGALRDS